LGEASPRPPQCGYRVITYDRRGFGKSSQPTAGYNYDTFAEDLHKLVTHLKLHDFTLVGFSMGGGEVARYIGKYGSKGVSKAVIISGVPPYLLKTGDNPEGVDASVFAGIEKAVAGDRYAFFTGFFQNFYNTDLLLGKRVSAKFAMARPAEGHVVTKDLDLFAVLDDGGERAVRDVGLTESSNSMSESLVRPMMRSCASVESAFHAPRS